jgi:hypothetical protein
MADYDFGPEDFEDYQPTQDQVSNWVGSAQRYDSQNPSFAQGDLYDDYDQDQRSRHRGRSPSRRPRYNDPSYGGDEFRRDLSQHTLRGGFTNSASGPMPPGMSYNASQNPTMMSFHEDRPDYDARGYSLRSGINQTVPRHPSLASLSLLNAPVPEQFPYSGSRNHSFYGAQAPAIPLYPSSRRSRSYSRPMDRYASSNIQVPITTSSSSRTRSSGTRSSGSRSYTDSYYSSDSDGSYSSTSSGSPPVNRRQAYRTVHASHNTPTIVQPSRDYPTVVPINGGVNGYVVVPAVGQNLRVVVRSQFYYRRCW